MPFPFIKFNISNLAVIAVTVVFLIGVFFGITKGIALAKAQASYETAVQIQKGLKIFFDDQERFPSTEEFVDTNILLTYFTQIPDSISKNAECKKNFEYKRLSFRTYQLDFCLAASYGGFRPGWNRINFSQ